MSAIGTAPAYTDTSKDWAPNAASPSRIGSTGGTGSYAAPSGEISFPRSAPLIRRPKGAAKTVYLDMTRRDP